MEVSSVFRYNAKDRIFQCYTCISVLRYAVLFRWSHFVNFLRWNGGLNRIYLQYAVLYLSPFWTAIRLSIRRGYQPVYGLPPKVETKILVFPFSRKFLHFHENCWKKCAKIRKIIVNNNKCWLFAKILAFRENLSNTEANACSRMKNFVYFARIWIIFAKKHKITRRLFSP